MDSRFQEGLQIDEGKKKAALQVIRRAAEEKRLYEKPSFFHILGGQLRYTSPSLWCGQAAAAAILFAVLCYFHTLNGKNINYLTFCSVFASFIGVFLVSELGKNFSYHMAEIEQSCYLNLRQVSCIKLAAFGSLDLLLLLIAIGGAGGNMEMPMYRFGVYTLVPFVVSNIIYLFAFTKFKNANHTYTHFILAFMNGFFSYYISGYSKVYEPVYFGIWAGILIAAAVLLGVEISHIMKMEEELCWN